jgi:hypothetical protein
MLATNGLAAVELSLGTRWRRRLGETRLHVVPP